MNKYAPQDAFVQSQRKISLQERGSYGFDSFVELLTGVLCRGLHRSGTAHPIRGAKGAQTG